MNVKIQGFQRICLDSGKWSTADLDHCLAETKTTQELLNLEVSTSFFLPSLVIVIKFTFFHRAKIVLISGRLFPEDHVTGSNQNFLYQIWLKRQRGQTFR